MWRGNASRSRPGGAEPQQAKPPQDVTGVPELMGDHLPVVQRIAARLKRRYPWVESEDLYGYASLGLALAASAYEPDRSIPFSHFAFSKGTYLAVDEMRKSRVLRRGDRSRPPYIYSSSTAWATSETARTDPVDAGWEKAWDQMEAKDHCESLLRGTSSRDRRLLMMYYGEGLTFKEVGDILGISESAVSFRHAAVMRRLRRLMRIRTSR